MYMFGMTLWELFSHDEPFGASVEITVHQVKDNELPPMVKPPDEMCPAAVWELVMSCIDRNPEHRPSIDNVLGKLSGMLEDEQARLTQLQVQQRAEETKQQAPPSPSKLSVDQVRLTYLFF